MTTSEPPLPGMPEPPPSRPVTRPATRAARFRGHELCGHCVLAIHSLGVGLAPYPRTARWRVTVNEVTSYLCESHKNEATST